MTSEIDTFSPHVRSNPDIAENTLNLYYVCLPTQVEFLESSHTNVLQCRELLRRVHYQRSSGLTILKLETAHHTVYFGVAMVSTILPLLLHMIFLDCIQKLDHIPFKSANSSTFALSAFQESSLYIF